MKTHLPPAFGLYDPAFEHDACGTGFVADLAGQPSHELVATGLTAVERMAHRGARAADGHSGDGAGVLTQLPAKLFARELAALGQAAPAAGDLAVGMLFLPRPLDQTRRAERLVDAALRAEQLKILAWREVPLDPSALGPRALATLPRIVQVFVPREAGLDEAGFARALYLARRRLEREVVQEGLDVYVCSLSHRTIVYKGLVCASALRRLYPDLHDPDYQSAICVFHQRFSTNTFPSWPLAQPFRLLGHNGEINAIAGNREHLAARESELTGGGWSAEALSLLRPVLQPAASDSCSLDNAFELLVASGRDPLHALRMLVPEAPDAARAEAATAFYAYHAGLIEPWDGPAALVFSDGTTAGACLDRNGLRPARFAVTDQGWVIVASEAGVIDVPAERIVEKGRLGPGEMLAADTREGRLLRHGEILQSLATRHPYGDWLQDGRRPLVPRRGQVWQPPADELWRRQTAAGYSLEDLDRLIQPMAKDGKESVGSMGDDTPLAVFSQKPRPLYHYFKQRFAQVTNPPIDALREALVQSLTTVIGPKPALFETGPEAAVGIELKSPVLNDGELAGLAADPASASLSAVFVATGGAAALSAALDRLCAQTEQAIAEGATCLILSDRAMDSEHAPIPMPLALGALHRHLIEAGKRGRAAIVCEAADVREEHHLAVLVGFGAEAVHPYLAFASARQGAADPTDAAAREGRYRLALERGLRKIMAKMGICDVASYRGARLFEAIGLDARLVKRFWPGLPARLGGSDLAAIAQQAAFCHAVAMGEPQEKLPDWGLFRFRPTGEYHQFNPDVFKSIQAAAKNGDARTLANLVEHRPVTAIRDLLHPTRDRPAVPLEEVEPAAAIARRFVACAMSLGALSLEAHSCIAIAMNRLGAKSNSGEGGEDAERFTPLPNGDSANSTIKQVASGRFGVTPRYLVSAEEIEIKMAQGSKPGEGGQLPAAKVDAYIARLRHATPGMSLISPPPHHDIYSIEDLAQLIHDLKRVNARARVGVKLVAEAGVGTIAAGVAKALADTIHLSGADGGTGASPLGSIKHAGAPWELGLAETQQVLVANGLRGRVRLRVDGGLKTGRDVLIAALLGAEEYGFGSALLVSIGCVMARQCHMNICPVGIATQDPKLRHKFKGDPDQIVHFLLAIAEEVREGLASLGVRTLDEAIGRVDWLRVREERLAGLPALDLAPLLVDADPHFREARRCEVHARQPVAPGPDDQVLAEAGAALAIHGEVRVALPIANTDRAVGARLAGAIADWHGDDFRGRLVLQFHGAAGQSFGAFALDGMALRLEGEANDYVGKGLAGGSIVLVPPHPAGWDVYESPILGNTALYGATGGTLYAMGRAGERFAVRNSGAHAVVEGIGDHGCEYMTGGSVVVLGNTGRNFGAGMTGGVAYVFDEAGAFPARCHPESVGLTRLQAEDEAMTLREWLEAYHAASGSERAAALLEDWEQSLRAFWVVRPITAATSATLEVSIPPRVS